MTDGGGEGAFISDTLVSLVKETISVSGIRETQVPRDMQRYTGQILGLYAYTIIIIWRHTLLLSFDRLLNWLFPVLCPSSTLTTLMLV